MRRWRASKTTESTPETAPYSHSSCLSRAVKVVAALCEKFREGAAELSTDGVSTTTCHPVNKTAPEVEDRIREFFLRPDNSWTAPGRKDCITVIRNGQKVKEQRRYLLMTLKEAFALYTQEYPSDQVKLAKFKSLHPGVVLYQSNMPHNVLVRQYHENINLLLQGISRVASIPINHRHLLSLVCCDIDSETCMFGQCHYCKATASAAFLSDTVEDDALTESVQWCQWIRTDEGKSEKVQKSVGDALPKDELQYVRYHLVTIKITESNETIREYI